MYSRPDINFPLTPYENFVFDFAGVLFQCDYVKFVRQAFPAVDNHAELADKIFKSEIFSDYDKNLIDTEELTIKLCDLIGCSYTNINNLILAIKEHMVPMQETVLLLYALKEKNVKLYGLTNMPKEIFNHLKGKYDFLSVFDDITVSSYLGLAKPELAVYQHVIDKNKIDPFKTIFVDDRPINLTPAEQLGIKTFLFTHASQLISDLRVALNVQSCGMQQSDERREDVVERRSEFNNSI